MRKTTFTGLLAWTAGVSLVFNPLPSLGEEVVDWGTQIWDPTSFYVPNEMQATAYDSETEERVSALCEQGWIATGGQFLCGGEIDSKINFQDSLPLEDGFVITGSTYLDPCSEAAENIYCIDSLRVAGSDGALTVAQVKQNEDDLNYRPDGGLSWESQELDGGADYPDFKLIASGQPSVWEASGAQHSGTSNLYSVNVVINFRYDAESGLSFPNYSATVIPVDMKTGAEYDKVTVVNNGGGSYGWSGNNDNCAWNDDDICAERKLFLENSFVELTVRLPKDVSGWYKGRVFDPEISADTANEDYNLVKISGTPAINLPYLTEVRIPLSQTPEDLKEFGESFQGGGQLLSDSDSSGIDFINAFKFTLLNNQANARNSVWQFSTIQLSDTQDQCYSNIVNGLDDQDGEGPGAIIGMVSTDSMVYSGQPPVLTDDGSLDYSVAGLSLDDQGQIVRASYSLSVREDYARCAYPVRGNLNPAVEVYEATNGLPKPGINVSSDTYTSSTGNQWWKVNVTGITFSNPIISVNLTGGRRSSVNDQAAPPQADRTERFTSRKRFSNFAPNSSRLSAIDKRAIRKFLRQNPGVSQVTCVGTSSGVPSTKSDRKLARARAAAACKFVVKVVPSVSTKTAIRVGQGNSKKFRSVILRIEGSKVS
jgi:hypothetical protein